MGTSLFKMDRGKVFSYGLFLFLTPIFLLSISIYLGIYFHDLFALNIVILLMGLASITTLEFLLFANSKKTWQMILTIIITLFNIGIGAIFISLFIELIDHGFIYCPFCP